MIKLETFKNNLRELARPNRFLVLYHPPSIYTFENGNPLTPDIDLTMHTKLASIPGKTINEFPVKYGGLSLKLPGDVEFQDLSVTVLNEADWQLKIFFENWQNIIINSENNNRASARELLTDSYVDVIQLDKKGENLVTYRFYNVYPKDIQAIELSMESNDTVEEFAVSFAYSHWEIGNFN